MNEINAASTFPEIPKLPYPEEFAPKKKCSKIDRALDKLAKFGDSEHLKTAHFGAEITSNVFSNISELVPKEGASEHIGHSANITGTFTDALNILQGLESVAIIVQNLKKKGVKGFERTILRLDTAKAFVDIISAVGAIVGIFDRFKVFELAKITEAMGKIPTIGQALSAAFPVPVVFSLFSIVSGELTIITSALKIKKMVERVKRATKKIKVNWNRPIDGAFAENKGRHIAKKQETCLENGKKLKVELEQMEPCLKTKKGDYETKQEAYLKLKDEVKSANKISKLFRKLGPKRQMKGALGAYKKEIKKYQKTHDQLKTLEKTHELQGEKILKWQAIENKCKTGSLTDSEKTALETMRTEKIKKWKAKKVNEYWDIAHEVARIALAIIGIALSLASIGVIIAFTGNVPAAALIAMGTIGLTLTATHLIRNLYFNRIKKKKVESVAVPDFRTLAAAT
jgi:hypothetical protein